MKLRVYKSQVGNVDRFLRRAGYVFVRSRHTGKESYIRRLRSTDYPRFHIYLMEDGDDKIIFHLHLDQKKPSYKGSNAHNAEYEGKNVENEIKRLITLIRSL